MKTKDLLLLFVCALVAAMPASAITGTVIFNFPGGSNGNGPNAGLTASSTAGVFYGTTFMGGTANAGTVFQIIDNGSGTYTETVIHTFDGVHGKFPTSPLTIDSSGNIYGVTVGYYPINGIFTDPGGSIFELSPDGSGGWNFVSQNFSATSGGGYSPAGTRLLIAGGYAYGSTAFGGTSNAGTIFRINTPQNNGGVWAAPSFIHSFNGTTEGSDGIGGLAMGAGGIIYGISANSANYSTYGTLWSLVYSGGWVFTVLKSFTGGTDGGTPAGDLLVVNGKIYGVTQNGGDPSCQCGVVYSYNIASGVTTTVHAFTGSTGDGASPQGGLVPDSSGALYGVAIAGGISGCGKLYSLSSGGGGTIVETALIDFFYLTFSACQPVGTLVFQSGAFYGASLAGGSVGYGTIFKIM